MRMPAPRLRKQRRSPPRNTSACCWCLERTGALIATCWTWPFTVRIWRRSSRQIMRSCTSTLAPTDIKMQISPKSSAFLWIRACPRLLSQKAVAPLYSVPRTARSKMPAASARRSWPTSSINGSRRRAEFFMSVAQETPIRTEPLQPTPPRRNGRWSGYAHLLMARMLELKREPEVVFWVFIFPLLLALGLGIAFRNKPGNAVSVAIVQTPGSPRLQAFLAGSPQHDQFKVQMLNEDQAHQAFRLGKFDLVIEPGANNAVRYLFDPARPESVLAKAEVNDALQTAFGRKDSVSTDSVASSEPGSRYIDFLI